MLSVIIITKNEESMLKTCLESVKWADEIIVADSGSEDKTLEIAKKYTDRVIKVTGNNFAGWRNQSLEKAQGDYVLFVDADERVLSFLKEEILQKMGELDSQEVAWAIPRRNIILGEEKSYKAFWPDFVVRLFKKDKLKGYQGEVHEQPVVDGKVGRFKNPFLHLTHRDIDSMVLKSLSWGNIDAGLKLKDSHPKMTGPRFIKILFTQLWKETVTRGGVFGGTVGVIDSLLQTFSVYISYVKLWQLQRMESLSETYSKIDEQLLKNDFRY
ncbi:hypothetical protein A3C32_04515 [Candidatus Daviesbacteria bacterium RIFCSPHIGHO2_02_FULL_41_14]|uniref:Glycosyltransferase 2-like domain-containing protein n=1 Tax=Candidatus Daviesbacteria bacterium RIFCSPLOWO2_01_FULL_40_24 TaxID=1797787 RepID=A0A1F5MJL3_9BACT|nr:MAG: hypothetical protein A3C32_04515 [Candidatus Daviesbacteria bacterium RIFCSPHIGHO2_02_FULL_41_14]OGE65490.1 MAG: hypothetical protein A3B49_01210 [Candidatus Daviesbacteria bacterium RIFCSPLOWO2_01_FULL_40_24]